MSPMAKSKFLSYPTFWKVCIGFIVFSLASVAFFQFLPSQLSDTRSKTTYENAILNRAQELSRRFEDRFLFSNVNELKALSDLLPLQSTQVESYLENWQEKRNDILCVSLWLKEKKWPVRVVRRGFWSDPKIQKISPADRQILFDFLFLKDNVFRSEKQPWVVGQLLPKNVLGNPILTLGLSLEGKGNFESLVAKISLSGMDTFLKESLLEGEELSVVDSVGSVLVSTGTVPFVPDSTYAETDRVIWNANQGSVRLHLTHLPWTICFSKKTAFQPGKQLWIENPRLTFFLGWLLIILILGMCIAVWIDRPLRKLIRTAAEMARGNFSLRIPFQRNREINKFAKLLNYMMEEMDRLQKMDVGDIINEKNKTEAILRNIADGVVVTDAQDRIWVINSVVEKWFGVNEHDANKKPIRECIKNQPLISLLQEVKDGKHHSVTEFAFQMPGEKEKVFQAHAARMHSRGDRFLGVVTVIRDITTEKEADRIKTELVSMVAHELKSPLTSIYGFSELLLESDLKDPQAKEYAQVIMTESSRLTDLVNKFLDLSRLEEGRTEIRMHPFDLRQVIAKIVETYKSQAEKKEIRVIAEISDNLPPALGDSDMIEQVLVNLFSNAVKYSPNRSKIGIEAQEQDNELIVSVIDNGYGIPAEALPKIFDKFFRVVNSEEDHEVEGSGLGLALAKEIVERHGGKIKVNSRLGVGSVFSFTLSKAEIK